MVVSDREFLAAVDSSAYDEHLVAGFLSRRGIPAVVTPKTKRGTFDERWSHSDDGDVHVTMVVQVKHRNIHFTSSEDYPYATILVDECYHLDSSRNTLGYFILNADRSHAAYIRTLNEDRARLEVEVRRDRRQGDWRKFYAVGKEDAAFIVL